MKYTIHKTITDGDIMTAIEEKYGVYIENVAQLLFDVYYNDSFKKLYIHDEGWKEDLRASEDEDDKNTLLILEYLDEEFPNDNVILVDVSW